VPYAERGRRTDTALRLLPDLLAGRQVRLPDEPDQPVVELAPPVSAPPFWVGNASPIAIRRAAGHGDGWFPSLVPADEIAKAMPRLAELASAHGRPTPTIAVGAAGALGSGPDLPSREEIAAGLTKAYGMPVERAVTIPITGTPREAAQRLAAYHRAGASHLVMGFSGGAWRQQCELLAEARAMLDE
jgi:alkanesulfonate monooxygenase SsuD/methylene tetrahydromethanopterin reductase-like flavin-dependent oxidoreductase (luciferase family)